MLGETQQSVDFIRDLTASQLPSFVKRVGWIRLERCSKILQSSFANKSIKKILRCASAFETRFLGTCLKKGIVLLYIFYGFTYSKIDIKKFENRYNMNYDRRRQVLPLHNEMESLLAASSAFLQFRTLHFHFNIQIYQ